MPQLFDHQITGAEFLASRSAALLADEQRVGKTAAAIRACDYVMARRILVVTTSSARAQWRREFREWGFPRKAQILFASTDRVYPDADVVIVSWSLVYKEPLRSVLIHCMWDVLLLDESHAAKSPGAKRTTAVFGHGDGLQRYARRVWCLSGTPCANSPADLFPMLSVLAPERMKDINDYDSFVRRYCVVHQRRIGGVLRDVIKGGKNLDELNQRVAGFWLRRTQQDVGIGKPIFSVFALTVDGLSNEVAADTDAQAVFDAIETGETASLEMHLGKLRRLTGMLKAKAVIEAATEALDDGLDKLVLMAWHTDVIDTLRKGLERFGVVGIDGRTPPAQRDAAIRYFGADASTRVFVGQIQAAGEAIDLSAAAELWFVEPSFVPKDMSQAAMRITNHAQKRQALVRVCALEGSIDEALMTVLTRKVETIRKVMEQ